jgi:hypothetical protein
LLLISAGDPNAKHLTAVQLHQLYSDEYKSLSDLEKEQIVEEHRELKSQHLKFRRPTTRGRVVDIANTILNMKKLVSNFLLVATSYDTDVFFTCLACWFETTCRV